MLKYLFIIFIGLSADLSAQVVHSESSVVCGGAKNTLNIGGFFMYDLAAIRQSVALDSLYEIADLDAEIRHARLYSHGAIYSHLKYKVQLELIGSSTLLKEAYIELSNIPLAGHARFGHIKEPFRLEVLTSGKYFTFMERGYHQPFVPVRNLGLVLFDDLYKKRLGWQFGLFKNYNSDNYNVTMRLTGLPYLDKNLHHYLHLGIGYSHRALHEDPYAVSFRPGSHLSPKYISSEISDVSRIELINVEAALILGPLSIQGEYLQASVPVLDAASKTGYTYYTQLSYFLTGEHRPYKNSYAGFARVKPKDNFRCNRQGLGAWEVAIRYENVSLTNFTDSDMSDFTIGVNWYINASTRVMTNYIIASIHKPSTAVTEHSNILQMRFQVDF